MEEFTTPKPPNICTVPPPSGSLIYSLHPIISFILLGLAAASSLSCWGGYSIIIVLLEKLLARALLAARLLLCCYALPALQNLPQHGRLAPKGCIQHQLLLLHSGGLIFFFALEINRRTHLLSAYQSVIITFQIRRSCLPQELHCGRGAWLETWSQASHSAIYGLIEFVSCYFCAAGPCRLWMSRSSCRLVHLIRATWIRSFISQQTVNEWMGFKAAPEFVRLLQAHV